MNDTADATYSPAQRLGIIASCMLGFALDLYDVLTLPYLMPSIQRSMHISLAEVASITTVTLIGSVAGGGLFGWLGDRIGRKAALQWTLVVFALASVGSAFAWNFTSLLVMRAILGIGLGGCGLRVGRRASGGSVVQRWVGLAHRPVDGWRTGDPRAGSRVAVGRQPAARNADRVARCARLPGHVVRACYPRRAAAGLPREATTRHRSAGERRATTHFCKTAIVTRRGFPPSTFRDWS